jgi:hypothetical protein
VLSGPVEIKNLNGVLDYKGNLSAPYLWPGWAPLGDARTYGAAAYDAMKPTKPLLNAFNPIYELKDLPGMIDQLETGFRRSLKGASDLFLSQIFGWMPMVGDVLKVIEAQQQLQKRIDWLLNNQGKWIPRRCKLLDSNTTYADTDWVDDYGAFEQSFTNSFYLSVPQRRDKYVYTDKIWACAQFQYFLPDPPPGVTLKRVVKAALNGNRSITLGNLYRAIPWTWMIEWAFSAGKVLDALDDGVADRLAARRFYLMRERSNLTERLSQGHFRGMHDQSVFASCSTVAQTVSKTRVEGSPFFPPIGDELSPMQYGILGALGLSKYG